MNDWNDMDRGEQIDAFESGLARVVAALVLWVVVITCPLWLRLIA